MKAETAGALVCALVGALVYLNTLPANFTFDDSFAVVYNGDVTQDSNPLWGLLQHDFWGQRIASEQSHKSFRPLTVLSFRLTRQAWSALPQRWRAAVLAYRSRTLLPNEENEAAKRGLDPLLFHCCNVVWHALVSALVCRLSYFLLLRRWSPTPLVLLVRQQPTLAASQSGAGPAAVGAATHPGAQAAVPARPVEAAAGRPSAGDSPGGAWGPSKPGLRKRASGPAPAVSEAAVAAAVAGATTHASLPSPARTGSAPCQTAGAAGARRHSCSDAVMAPWLRGSHRRSPGSAASASASASASHEPPSTSSSCSGSLLLRRPLVQLHVPAWFAGLAFATHPVHTEAVAGVVGQAELICAALSIPAVMIYLAAAERAAAARLAAAAAAGRSSGSEAGRGRGSAGARHRAAVVEALAHWGGVAAAVCLALAAALAKEIGITVLGLMLAADAVLVPLVVRVPGGAAPPPGQWRTGHTGQMVQEHLEEKAEAEEKTEEKVQERADEQAGSGAAADARAVQPTLLWRLVRAAVWVAAEEPKWLRLCVLVAAGVGYVKMRSAVAVDQLVRIYRKVENPIPFSTSPTERLLTTAHLHARYAGLLLWPQHLSADWSFACVPLVAAPQDPRNALSGVLYAYLLAVVVAAAPWGVLADWARAFAAAAAPVVAGGPGIGSGTSGGKEREGRWGQTREETQEQEARGWGQREQERRQARLWAARWRLLVVAGLVVGPYFPASNVLFYVGTFIGERLLYFPSIGYCLLLAELAAMALHWTDWVQGGGGGSSTAAGVDEEAKAGEELEGSGAGRDGAAVALPASNADGGGATVAAGEGQAAARLKARGSSSSRGSTTTSSSRRGGGGERGRGLAGAVVRLLVYGCMAGTLAGYSWRTWVRNADWLTEEALFEAANRVCGDSAKVQLNMGILMRRKGDQAAALAHFRRARAIEPGYCEPAYWIGVTLINMGQPEGGLSELEAALGCKYVAAEAVKSLNTIYRVLHSSSPRDPTPVLRWGLLLLRPELGQTAEGCDMVEQAAAMYAAAGRPQEAEGALARCADAVRQSQGEQQGERVAAAGGGSGAEVAREVFGLVVEAARKKAPPAAMLLRCLEARAPLYRALALAHSSPGALRTGGGGGGGPLHPAVRAAAYRYLRRVESLPHCRRAAATMALSAADQVGSTPPHLHLMHMVQSSDPEDAWLQAEWGRVLQEVGRGQEAVMHFSVSAVLLHQQLEGLQAGRRPTALSLQAHGRQSEAGEEEGEEQGEQAKAGEQARKKKKKAKAKEHGRGGQVPAEVPLSAREALQGIASSLEGAARQRPPTACELWGRAVEARRMLAVQALGAGNTAEYGRQQAALVAAVGELQGLMGATGAAQPQCAAALSAAMGLGGGAG